MPDQVAGVDAVGVDGRERVHRAGGYLLAALAPLVGALVVLVAGPERPDYGASCVAQDRVKVVHRQGRTQSGPLVVAARGESVGEVVNEFIRTGRPEVEQAEFGRRQVVADPGQRAGIFGFGTGSLVAGLGGLRGR